MDKKTEHILLGIMGTVEETKGLIDECRIDIERKRGVVAGLQLAITALNALVAKKGDEARKAEDEGKISAGEITLVKREIAGINGSHAAIMILLQDQQREQRIAEGRMDGYANLVKRSMARVEALKQQNDRRKRDKKEDKRGGRPAPVRQALGRDKLSGKKKKAAKKKTKKEK